MLRRYKSNKAIVLMDIDNTVADTWPCISVTYESYAHRLISLPVFINMRNKIIAYDHAEIPIFFISARNRGSKLYTTQWLRSMEIPVENKLVYIVYRPETKLWMLKLALSKQKQIYYYDDLSYNHENGEVKYYQHLIKEIQKTKANYFDKQAIDTINKQEYA